MNRQITLGVLVLSIVWASCGAAARAGAAPEPVVPNGSFEKVEKMDRTKSAIWRTRTWSGKAKLEQVQQGRGGSMCVTIASTDPEGADASWSAFVPVKPFSSYKVKGWIKVENVASKGGKGAVIHAQGREGQSPVVTGSEDWREVAFTFDSGTDDAVELSCSLGWRGKATGKAFFDDLTIELLDSKPMDFGKITVDAAAKGPAMPAEIYSQFIEHLGRCIYGGIWAEMLEDRKFYFPITAEFKPYRSLEETEFPVVGASPWQIVGEADSVKMNAEKPFVGKHTPSIHAGAGVRQNDLGIVQGKKYAGYAWAKSKDTSASAVVRLRWGEGNEALQAVTIEKIGREYQKLAFEFTAGASTDKASLEFLVTDGTVFLGTISLMPADNIEGMRADTLALLKELDAPIYRWPGGNFVSGYDWRDGIGDRDRRPPRTNPAWTGVEHNDFGMHEFIRFCELIKTQPWITVNTGFGDAYSAAAQLEYCNGTPDTLWGKRRAENGAPKPFAVKYWGVGNEMWGPWQLGFMKLEHYVIKQNWVVDKMREVDPKIVCISSGNAGPWSTGLLKASANHMDLIAEHYYTQERPGILAHIRQMNDNIKKKADFHRKQREELPELKGKDIKIAMTEWNYWYGPHEFGELGTRYFLKDALGIAAGLHEYARNSDIIASAFYAQTVNVIGCIKTSRTAAVMDSTGVVLALYRKELGTIPVKTTASELLDVQALLTADGKFLTIGAVNPWPQALELPLEIAGAKIVAGGNWTAYTITGDGLKAYNEPGKALRVKTQKTEVPAGTKIQLPPQSVMVLRVPVE